jgi:CheY-like chemotaxis protein
MNGSVTMNRASRSATILLVEDEVLIAEMIALALEDQGYRVHIATSAAEALDHLVSGGALDILFTDINLPGEMDGIGLAARIREMLPDLPVIYASGRWSLLEKLQWLPRSAVLPKPYSVTRACEAIARLLDPSAPLSA